MNLIYDINAVFDALVDHDAAVMILDADATSALAQSVKTLLADKKRLATLAKNVKAMAQERSDERIVDCIYNLCSTQQQ